MNFNCSSISNAICKNDVESFKELINKRKRIDIPDNLGYTSLHIAASKNASIDPYIIDTLLNHPDVEINCKTVEGFTSLYIACKTRTPNIKIIKKFLIHGADANISDTEQVAPLHLACKFGNLQLIQLLVKYNANINIQDFNMYTPLHYSLEYKQKEVVKYLVIKANADVDITNMHGLNSLMYAIETKQKIARFLIDYTKNLNSKTKDNFTSLQLAIKRNQIRIAEMLINKNVDVYLSKDTSVLLMQALKENNYAIYKMIWRKIDPKRLKKYEEIFRNILIGCNAINDFQYIQLIINDNRLVCDFKGQKGILAFIFYKGTNLNDQYTNAYFSSTEYVYNEFFSCLIMQGIGMSSADVESFIFYFHTCSYRLELLRRLLDATKPDITEHLVIYAFEYDLKMGALLLEHCLDVYPENLFDNFTRHMSRTDNWDILEHVLKYFTPTKAYMQNIINKYIIAKAVSFMPPNPNVLKWLNNEKNVKSLRELSRDVIREQFQETCETSSEFLEKVQTLVIPSVIKDYITLKLTVRSP